jgi:hypothetical protein
MRNRTNHDYDQAQAILDGLRRTRDVPEPRFELKPAPTVAPETRSPS